MAVTLQAVADRAGVSLPTVSHILSSRSKRAGLFAEDTRRRVREVAAELGYRPNAAARTVATGRFGAVAVLQSTFHNRSILPDQLVAGIDSVLGERDMHLTLARLPDEKLTNSTYVPRILRQLTSDGLLINYNAHIPARMIELIGVCDLPAIWINSQHAHDCVYPDDERAAYEGTVAMLRLSHKRIAFVDYTYGRTSQSRHYSNPARHAGYARAMAEAGLAPRVITGESHLPYEERLVFTRAWLAADDRPSAVFTYSGQEIAAITATGDRLGLNLPADLAMVGVHDEPIRHFDLRVATMVLPEFAIGAEATRLLLRKIDDRTFRASPTRVALTLDAGDTLLPPLS